MHFAVVTEGLPHQGTSGDSVFMWTVLKHLRELGYRVTACIVLDRLDALLSIQEQKSRVEALCDLGIEVVCLETPIPGYREDSRVMSQKNRWLRRLETLHRAVYPTLASFYPTVTLAPRLAELLERAKPDAIYGFDLGPVAALQDIRIAPRMATPGDPRHLTWRYALRDRPLGERLSRAYLFELLAYACAARKFPRWILQVLSKHEAVGFLGAQHAAWVRENGIKCLYFPVPVADTAGPEWEARRQSSPIRDKPRILLFGSLVSTASFTGFRLLARETLPILERELGIDGFEIHIVGRGTLPPDIEKGLRRPSVQLRGYVKNPADELVSADVVLAPSPFPVGVRVRIVHAFSFGCCVVAHRLSAAGIPELVNGENCLLARNGCELAAAVLRAWRDPVLRMRLGRNARRTYESTFHPMVAVGKIASELERIAKMGMLSSPLTSPF